MELLDRIDRAVDGLCPCGAEPRPGSAYCCDDCTPTHVAGDTDTSGPGRYGAQSTAMRWRPDLVAAVDDTGRTLLRSFRRGPYQAQIFEYPDAPGTLHLRLDDGTRFVGVDTEPDDANLQPVWRRLERELTNQQHLEPSRDPWADVFNTVTSAGVRISWRRRCIHCGQCETPVPGRRLASGVCDVPALCPDPQSHLHTQAEPEDCDLCAHCQQPFPGPPLQVYAADSIEDGCRIWTMRLGGGRGVQRIRQDSLERAVDPDVFVQTQLDGLERRLLDEYARRRPNRPDVRAWLAAANAGARRDHPRRGGMPVSVLGSVIAAVVIAAVK